MLSPVSQSWPAAVGTCSVVPYSVRAALEPRSQTQRQLQGKQIVEGFLMAILVGLKSSCYKNKHTFHFHAQCRLKFSQHTTSYHKKGLLENYRIYLLFLKLDDPNLSYEQTK